jgi:glycosidase
MAIFQFTYLGAPMVYYGDEAGMWGANDPDCRKPMIWYDMEYEDELYKPDQTKYDKPNAVSFNQEMFEHYKMLAKIRNNHPALRLGDFIDLLADDEDRILIFSRVYKSEKIIVAINNDKENHSPVINTESALSFNDLLDGSEINPTDGKLKIEIPAKWGRILLQSQKKR